MFANRPCRIYNRSPARSHLQELLDLGDTSGPSDQNDIVDARLVHLGVLQALLDGLHALAEQVHVELLKAGARDRGGKVHALEQRVQLDGGLGGRRQRALGALAGGTQPGGDRII